MYTGKNYWIVWKSTTCTVEIGEKVLKSENENYLYSYMLKYEKKVLKCANAKIWEKSTEMCYC